jgi:hypothetical protein
MNMLHTVPVQCPYCGEEIEVVVDGSVSSQEYVEDCSVCCNPIVMSITTCEDGDVQVAARAENE